MKFTKQSADIYVPDGEAIDHACDRTTHVAIGAHHDDLEVMAYHGIAECFNQKEKWYTGVTVTNGAGSSRTGPYAKYTDEEMRVARRHEQRKAAYIGEYSAQFQLDYASDELKSGKDDNAVEDIYKILKACQAETVYLHNPADKHDTHVAVLNQCLHAIRKLPLNERPKNVYGCEGWRNLDWVLDSEKVTLSCSAYPNLANALISVFDSQITGGKRYDLAISGRRVANATFHQSHHSDEDTAITWAIDLSPLIQRNDLSLKDFIGAMVDRFRKDVQQRIDKLI